MKALIILAHQHAGSFNHAIAHAARETLEAAGHDVTLHDLYAESFDPVLPASEVSEPATLPPVIQRHCAEVKAADALVIVHPNWWGQPPAILKGWLDRVLRLGVAYRFESLPTGEGRPVGLLKVTGALVFTTANTPDEVDRNVFGDPLSTIWEKCVLPFCGVRRMHRESFSPVIVSTLAQRQVWLQRVRTLAAEWFPASG